VPVLKKNGEYALLAEEEYNRLVSEGKIVGRDFVQVGPPLSPPSPQRSCVHDDIGGTCGDCGCSWEGFEGWGGSW
jgi:hypothetical protein